MASVVSNNVVDISLLSCTLRTGIIKNDVVSQSLDYTLPILTDIILKLLSGYSVTSNPTIAAASKEVAAAGMIATTATSSFSSSMKVSKISLPLISSTTTKSKPIDIKLQKQKGCNQSIDSDQLGFYGSYESVHDGFLHRNLPNTSSSSTIDSSSPCSDDMEPGVNFLFVIDRQGLTIAINEVLHASFCSSPLLIGKDITWNSNNWRALDIHAGNGDDTSIILAYLSSKLSQGSISILNYTTFTSDLILVQEKDLEKAIQILRSAANSFHSSEQLRLHLLSTKNSQKPIKTRDTDYLQVLSTPLALLRLNPLQLKRCMFGIMDQITKALEAQRQSYARSVEMQEKAKDEDFQEGKRDGNVISNNKMDVHSNEFFALISTTEETSLITSWDSLNEVFEPGSILVSPRPFIGIRYCGYDFDLSETGLVSLLFSPAIGNPGVGETITCSNFFTSYVFVNQENVELSLSKIKKCMISGDKTMVIGLPD